MKLGYLFKEGVKNAWSNRTMTIASIAVLVSCLLLTGSAVLFSMNLAKAMEVFQGGNSIQVYLDDGLPTLESVKIGEAIKSIDNVENCEFVSKDEAVQSYIDALGGDGDILAGLTGENNPLPDAFRISLKDLSIYEETAQQILSIEGVQKINDYSEVGNQCCICIRYWFTVYYCEYYSSHYALQKTGNQYYEIGWCYKRFCKSSIFSGRCFNRMYFRFDFQWFGCIGIQLCNEGYFQPDVIVHTIAVINSHSLDYFSVCWGRYFIWTCWRSNLHWKVFE